MSFRDEMQQAAAIQLMLEASGLPALQGRTWFQNGQMTEAFEKLYRMRGKLSSGEQVMVRAAYDLWTWKKELRLIELRALEKERLDLVLDLFRAFAVWDYGAAVDCWILQHRERGLE